MSVWGLVRWPAEAFGELVVRFLDVWQPGARDLELRVRYPDMDGLVEREAEEEVLPPGALFDPADETGDGYLSWPKAPERQCDHCGTSRPVIEFARYWPGRWMDDRKDGLYLCHPNEGQDCYSIVTQKPFDGADVPFSPYFTHLSWGVDGATSQPEPPLRQQCMRCGGLATEDHTCLRNEAAEEKPVEHAFFPCGVYAPDRDALLPYRCTLEDGHSGNHVAWAGKLPIAEWSDGSEYVIEPTLPKSSPVPPAGGNPGEVEPSPTAPSPGVDIQITRSQRGFERYGQPVDTAYGHKVSVYESSAASAPHVWLSVEHEGGNSFSPHSARAHLTLDQAAAVLDRLQVAVAQLSVRVLDDRVGDGGFW